MSLQQKIKSKGPSRFIQAPKGMHDVLVGEEPYWERIETVTRKLAKFYNFSKIDTPILEYADLFKKTIGEETDVIEKEMYTLKTKGGDMLALRPEFTPSICRAYLEHSLSRLGQPQKLYYFGPVFRHDRPQLGRFRQFSQFGVEVLGGVNDPIYDAQVILMLMSLLEELGVKNTSLKINSMGCRVCRPVYKKQLQNFYKNKETELCVNCAKRLTTNPLRLLDCKNESCVNLKTTAPNFLDKLCVTCSAHFKGVLEYLDELQISYALDHQLVRGLDYYNRTVFEVFVEGVGGEVGAVAAGGRYDYLMETLGSHLTPAVGWACGVERLVIVMKAQNTKLPAKSNRRVYLVHAGDSAKKKALKLMKDLWAQGIPISESLAKGSLRAQLKSANKEGIVLALILGQKEIYENSVILRNMRTGLQENFSLDRIVVEIKKRWREL